MNARLPVYYTYLDASGKPRVDPGPLLSHRERLATFFFNEINRARPQVHSLLLRAMAERSVGAFNQTYHLPHLQVFADRNRVEREETFELPAAAKDRFMFEISLVTPSDEAVLQALMFNPRYHDTDRLVQEMGSGQIAYYQLNDVAASIQAHIHSSDKLKAYALALWQASHEPAKYGVQLQDVDMAELIQAGASPRGMSYFIRAAKTRAWLEGRDNLSPLRELSIRKDESGQHLRPDAAPQPLDNARAIYGLWAAIAVTLSSAGGLAYTYGYLPGLPKRRVFKRAAQQLASLSDMPTTEALTVFHQALNAVNGAPLFHHQLADFYQRHPAYQAVDAQLRWFFQISNQYFFSDTAPRQPGISEQSHCVIKKSSFRQSLPE